MKDILETLFILLGTIMALMIIVLFVACLIAAIGTPIYIIIYLISLLF
jgi:hypothetical protein